MRYATIQKSKEDILIKKLLTIIILLTSGSLLAEDFVNWRGPENLDSMQFHIQQSFYFSDINSELYDWDSKSYNSLSSDRKPFYDLTSYTVIGFGIIKELEVFMILPLVHREHTEGTLFDTDPITALGDLTLYVRAYVLKAPFKLNISLWANFPTGSNDTDRAFLQTTNKTYDVGFALIGGYDFGNGFSIDATFAYVINTNYSYTYLFTDYTVDNGDNFIYNITANFKFLNRFTASLMFSGKYTSQLQLQTNSGSFESQSQTDLHRFYITPKLGLSATKNLTFAFKFLFAIPPLCYGGTDTNVNYVGINQGLEIVRIGLDVIFKFGI
jgi:hypothetical protein